MQTFCIGKSHLLIAPWPWVIYVFTDNLYRLLQFTVSAFMNCRIADRGGSVLGFNLSLVRKYRVQKNVRDLKPQHKTY